MILYRTERGVRKVGEAAYNQRKYILFCLVQDKLMIDTVMIVLVHSFFIYAGIRFCLLESADRKRND